MAALSTPKPERVDDRPRLVALSSMEVQDVKWIWNGYIPANKITILDGDGGIGKSLIVLDIMARLTTGDSMPDGTLSDIDGPLRVAYFNHEDNPFDTILPRGSLQAQTLSF